MDDGTKDRAEITKITERLEKLIRLRDRAGTEHEAAAAAGKIAELLAKYRINEAELNPDQEQRDAEIGVHHFEWKGKIHRWEEWIGTNVASLLGVSFIIWNGRVSLGVVGRPAMTKWFEPMTVHICQQIRAASKAYDPPKATLNPLKVEGMAIQEARKAFRASCSEVVCMRIREEAERYLAAQQALVVCDQKANQEYIGKHFKVQMVRRAPSRIKHHHAKEAGARAGMKIDINRRKHQIEN